MAAISSDDPHDKLFVENLFKIFGPESDEASRLLEQGLSNDRLGANTNDVWQTRFNINFGYYF